MSNKEAAQAAIKARIGGDKGHGWGIDDSLAVIVAVIANDNGAEAKDVMASMGDSIKPVINPSAFRQALEQAGLLNPSAKKVSGILAGL